MLAAVFVQSISLTAHVTITFEYAKNAVVDKTLTPSPWITLMDYPNGLPKWTTLKWTTPKNTVSDEYYIKKLRFYTYTAQTCIFLFRMAFSRHVE